MNMRRMGEFVADVLGPKLIADTGEWGTYAWSQFVLGTPGMRIAGGTDEVMRNIVGERVLGLPKDAGIDSTQPVPRPEGRHPDGLTAVVRDVGAKRPAPAQQVRSRRSIAARQQVGERVGRAGEDGDAERGQDGGLVRGRAPGAPSSDSASSTSTVTPAPHQLGDAAPASRSAIAALEQVGDEDQHGVAPGG